VAAKAAESPWTPFLAPRDKGEKRYWLVKSEPDTFSFADLMKSPSRTTRWDGVRNFTARNFLRDGMKKGDGVLFYHSSTDEPGIVGVCEVVRDGYPDPTADDPKWFAVDIRGVRPLEPGISLKEMKSRPELSGMAVLRIGRLSVTPVTPAEWKAIVG
jgi:predicted RNA-binding protein with PUA-like domain